MFKCVGMTAQVLSESLFKLFRNGRSSGVGIRTLSLMLARSFFSKPNTKIHLCNGLALRRRLASAVVLSLVWHFA